MRTPHRPAEGLAPPCSTPRSLLQCPRPGPLHSCAVCLVQSSVSRAVCHSNFPQHLPPHGGPTLPLRLLLLITRPPQRTSRRGRLGQGPCSRCTMGGPNIRALDSHMRLICSDTIGGSLGTRRAPGEVRTSSWPGQECEGVNRMPSMGTALPTPLGTRTGHGGRLFNMALFSVVHPVKWPCWGGQLTQQPRRCPLHRHARG